MNALNKQVDGDHYKKFVIQPTEFIHKNNIPFIEGNVIKYICRWRDKGGMKDLDKVIHYIELLKELESGNKERCNRRQSRIKTSIQGWRRELGSNLRKKDKRTEINSGGYGPIVHAKT